MSNFLTRWKSWIITGGIVASVATVGTIVYNRKSEKEPEPEPEPEKPTRKNSSTFDMCEEFFASYQYLSTFSSVLGALKQMYDMPFINKEELRKLTVNVNHFLYLYISSQIKQKNLLSLPFYVTRDYEYIYYQLQCIGKPMSPVYLKAFQSVAQKLLNLLDSYKHNLEIDVDDSILNDALRTNTLQTNE